MKKWLFIGIGLIATVAIVLGIKKEKGLEEERINVMIREVDEKPAEEKEIEKMSADVDKAISDIDEPDDEDLAFGSVQED